MNRKSSALVSGVAMFAAAGAYVPIVREFPEIVVCLNCGTAQFAVPVAELRLLQRCDACGGE
jgi:hypothetical protein